MGLFFDATLWDGITLLCIAGSLIYYLLTSKYGYWKKLNVPYIEPTFFFGNTKDMVTGKSNQLDVMDGFYKYFKQFGLGYGGIYIFHDPVFFVYSPELIKDVLVKSFAKVHDRGFSHDIDFDPMTTQLIFLTGARWKYLRAKLSPTFTSGKLKHMVSTISKCGDALEKKMEEASETGEMIEFKELTGQFATDVIGSCSFGLEINSIANPGNDFRKYSKQALETTAWTKFRQNFSNVYPRLYKLFKIRYFEPESMNFFVNIFNETAELRARDKIKRNDFMQLLLDIKHSKVTKLKGLDETDLSEVENYNTDVSEKDLEITDNIIAAQAFGFFLAGYETASATMSHLLLEVAKWPEIQDKISDEIKEVLQHHGGELNYDTTQDLKYMDQVINETLRMYPSVPMINRECTQRYKAPGSDFYIEPGLKLYIPIWSIHRDPELWPEPEVFKPERFAPENAGNIKPYSYLPFGHGPRTCIGMRFAILEMKIALSKILRDYKVVPCEKTKPFRIDPTTFALSCKDNVWLKVEKRS